MTSVLVATAGLVWLKTDARIPLLRCYGLAGGRISTVLSTSTHVKHGVQGQLSKSSLECRNIDITRHLYAERWKKPVARSDAGLFAQVATQPRTLPFDATPLQRLE